LEALSLEAAVLGLFVEVIVLGDPLHIVT